MLCLQRTAIFPHLVTRAVTIHWNLFSFLFFLKWKFENETKMSISISWIGKKQTGEAAVSRDFNYDPYFSLYENYVVYLSVTDASTN